MVLLAFYLAPSSHQRLLMAAGVVGVVLAVALALLFRRWPWALAFLTLACVPARIPVRVGGTEANLLVPLYAVVAGAALLLAWELVRGAERSRELGPLAWPLAAYVAWTGASLLWSGDPHQGAISVFFFYLPFGLLTVSLSRLPWNPRAVLWLLGELVAMAIAFAVIGVYQWATRDIFWNPKVIVGNAYAPFFRVNSVFYDPSVYGRFLVVALLAAVVVVLYERRATTLAAVVVLACAIWAGLLVSFSQSSFAALIVGTLVASALVWKWRALFLALVTAAAVVAIGFATPSVRHTLLSKTSSSWDRATSGRASLVANGVRIAADHPFVGVGVGGFKRAYADRVGFKGKEPKRAASHNAAVTVAAEAGIPGFVLLLWLVGGALFAAARCAGPTWEGRAAAWTAASLAAIVLHSLFYAALLEDAIFWGLLAACALWVRSASATRVATRTNVNG
jgi:O-antigen ligase